MLCPNTHFKALATNHYHPAIRDRVNEAFSTEAIGDLPSFFLNLFWRYCIQWPLEGKKLITRLIWLHHFCFLLPFSVCRYIFLFFLPAMNTSAIRVTPLGTSNSTLLHRVPPLISLLFVTVESALVPFFCGPLPCRIDEAVSSPDAIRDDQFDCNKHRRLL